MYFKIAKNNVKKSFKNYTIYFLTLTFAVCIFYSFNSVGSQESTAMMNESQASYAKLMGELISWVSLFVSIILGQLIIYATNFIISKRKKEFGVYMTLGMSRRKISTILLIENIIIGFISLAVGLMIGILASQGLSILVSKLFVVDMTEYNFVISSEAFLKTVFYFGIMYLVVIVFNVFTISKYKLIDLIYGGKKNEKIRVKNIYVCAVLFIASLVSLGVAYYYAEITNLVFTDVRFTVSIILGIIGTTLFFYSLSSILLFLLQRNKNIYLNNLNTFNVRQIVSKFNTNFISMTTICLMLFVTIGVLSTGISMKDSMETSLENKTPFDASVSLFKKEDSNQEVDISVPKFLNEKGYTLGENEDYTITHSYIVKADFNGIKDYLDGPIKKMVDNEKLNEMEVVTISDLNNIRKMKGKELIDLKGDEVLVLATTDIIKSSIDKFLKDNDTFVVGDKTLNIKEKTIYRDSLKSEGYGDIIMGLIVPDKVVEGIEPLSETANINFNGKNDKEAKNQITEISNSTYNGVDNGLDYYVYGETREMIYDQSRGLSTVMLFIAMYLGIVFLLASVAVLALQQLSHCNESLDRYDALRKIGASKSMINKSIFIQVLVFFMLPLSLAIVHSLVGIDVVSRYIKYVGDLNILVSSFFTALIMIIVYGGYFYATYIGYKGAVSDAPNL